jgi:2-isopropylmalate synthase
MSGEQKWRYFQMLVQCGFKEIEVAFPSASQTEFDFVRRVIETPGIVPDDVAIQVLTPCREELIRRTVESVRGAKKAILHLYNATSPCFRQVVFNNTKEETIELAVRCTKLVRHLTKDTDPNTHWTFEYSPETFSATELDFSVEICEAVKAVWEPTEDNPIIFNLPATVEMSTPNVYADQIEYFCTHISEREKCCISLHPHNDRGCATAAAELAQMGGADRVEGVLFGNGERTGNVDIVTLALNLYSQGVKPGLDFSNLSSIMRIVAECNNIPIHPRHPYAGDLVFTAFSGSHQDAIKKGFAVQRAREDGIWDMPYLPIDPKDLGATYEAVIRVNSQSGKGGISWIIQENLELDLPRRLQIAFARIVQTIAEAKGRELTVQEITNAFTNAYISTKAAFQLSSEYKVSTTPQGKTFEGIVIHNGKEVSLTGNGNGPVSSLIDALVNYTGVQLDVRELFEHAIGKGKNARAAAYIEVTAAGQGEKGFWGVGIDDDTV